MLEERDPERERAWLHVVCMDIPTCFVLCLCLHGCLEEILRGRQNCFLCSPPGVASLKGGTVVSLLGCISLFILFWHEGSNTKRFCNLHVNLYFKSETKHSFCFSVMSVDVKHCRHVEHCFLVSREAQSAKHSSDVEFVASSVMFACWMSMDTCGQGWTAFHVLCNLLDEALQVRDSKPVALRSSGIHSHAQVRPADN